MGTYLGNLDNLVTVAVANVSNYVPFSSERENIPRTAAAPESDTAH